MKNLLYVAFAAALVASCGGKSGDGGAAPTTSLSVEAAKPVVAADGTATLAFTFVDKKP